jgi:hypothetical protein
MLPLFFSSALSLSSAVAKQTYPVPLGRPDRSLVNSAPFLHTFNPEDQSVLRIRSGLTANVDPAIWLHADLDPLIGMVRYT